MKVMTESKLTKAVSVPTKGKVLIKGISMDKPIFYRQEATDNSNEVTTCKVTYRINPQELLWDRERNSRVANVLFDNMFKLIVDLTPKKKRGKVGFYNCITITSTTKRKSNDPNDWDTAERIALSKCNSKILRFVNRALKMTIDQFTKDRYMMSQVSDKVSDAVDRENKYICVLSTKYDKNQLYMTSKEFIDFITNYKDEEGILYTLGDVEDVIPKDVKLVKRGMNIDKHRWYEVSSNVYQCSDGFVEVHGVNHIFSEGLLKSDVGTDEPIECYEVERKEVISYEYVRK